MKNIDVYGISQVFKARLTMAVVLLLVSSGTLLAQGYHSQQAKGYVGLRAGYIELEDVDDSGSFNWGIYGGGFLLPWLSLELSLDRQTSEIVIYGDHWVVDIPILDRETTALQAGLKLMPVKNGPIRPFFTGGVGYYFSEYVDDRGFFDYFSDTIDEGGYYAGGGLELFGHGSRAKGFTVTWDNRWLFTEKERWRDNHVKADGWNTSLGLTFRF